MNISLEGARRARIKSTLSGGVLDLIRSIPTGVTWDERDAIIELNAATYRYIREKFPDAEWDSSVSDIIAGIELRLAEMAKASDDKYRAIPLSEDGFEYKRNPLNHQRKGFVLGRDKIGYMYFMEPGTGKTKITADTACYLYEKGKIKALFVLAENGLHLQWPEELAKDLPERLLWKHVIYKSSKMEDVRGTDTNLSLKLDWLVDQDCLRVMLMNIEALSTTKGKEWAQWFVTKQPTLTVVDESQLIGVPGSIRTRNAWSVGRKSTYRRILTGTPVAEGIERIYSQCLFTDFRILELSRYSQFKERYCKLWGKWGKIVGYQNLDDLMYRVEPYSFAIEKKDCMDLPPQTFEKVTVELNATQAKLYKELRDEYIAEIKSGSVVQAELVIARLVKLQQITSGFIRDTAGEVHILGADARLSALTTIVSQARRKCIVWCAFQTDVHLIEQALRKHNIECALYYGGISIEQCKANLERWRKPAGPKVFLATLKKAVRGLTLNEADTVAFYSQTWSNEARTQSLARNYRIGQDVPVTVFDILAPGTVDVKIHRDVNKKANIKKLVESPKAVLEWLDAPLVSS